MWAVLWYHFAGGITNRKHSFFRNTRPRYSHHEGLEHLTGCRFCCTFMTFSNTGYSFNYWFAFVVNLDLNCIDFYCPVNHDSAKATNCKGATEPFWERQKVNIDEEGLYTQVIKWGCHPKARRFRSIETKLRIAEEVTNRDNTSIRAGMVEKVHSHKTVSTFVKCH